jgi:hypothetical protein
MLQEAASRGTCILGISWLPGTASDVSARTSQPLGSVASLTAAAAGAELLERPGLLCGRLHAVPQ